MEDSYVCSGATMKCTFGTQQAKLTVLPLRTVFLTGQPMANISDHLSFDNLGAFGLCRSLGFPATASATAAAHGVLTPRPCMHNTPFPWMGGKNDYIIKGAPALLKSSTCQCMWGGTISIVNDGQRDTGKADLSRDILTPEVELNREAEAKSKLEADSVLDGIQTALDLAGFAPGLGAVPDLLNAAIYAIRGDMTNAGLSLLAAVPGIGDATAAAKIVGKGVKAAKNAKATKKSSMLTDSLQSGKKVDAEPYNRKALRRNRAKMAGLDPDAPYESSILYDTAPEQPQKRKFLDLIKRNPENTQAIPMKDNNTSGLTKNDQWEIEKKQAWDNVKKSQKPSSSNHNTIKNKFNIPESKIDKPIPNENHPTPSPKDVLKDNKMNKYGDFKLKPEYNGGIGKADVGKKLDIDT